MSAFGLASARVRRATMIDLRSWGTFSRASEGSYLISAPTTGSTAFMHWASNDVRRFEDRGDGNGKMLLLEGSRTNMVYPTERHTNIWSNPGGCTVTLDYGPCPDGRLRATRVQAASGAAVPYYIVMLNQTGNIDYVASYWRRSSTGTTSAQDLLFGGGPISANANNALTTTYERAVIKRQPHVPTTVGVGLVDGSNETSNGGVAAGARDEVHGGVQLEQASFASSYIRSTDSLNQGITRAADILSGPMSTVPVAMVNGTFTFHVAPVFSSAEGIRSASDKCLFSFAEDDSERIYFYVTGGAIYIRVVSGGVEKVKSNALTFSNDQKLTVAVSATSGSITVSGATTGNGTVTGTAWTRTTGPTMYVGSRQGGTQNAFVRLGPVNVNPSTKKVVLFMLGQSNMQVNSITAKILGQVQMTYPLAKRVEFEAGGTTLYYDWNKHGTAGSGAAYANALAAWDTAVTQDPDLLNATPIIIWGQGETDASSAGWSVAYTAAELNQFFTDIETDRPFFAGCQKIIHMLNPTCALDTSGTFAWAASVRSGETAYQAAHPTTVTTVEVNGLTTYDGVHYDDASTTILAQRDAAVVAAIIGP